MMMMMVLMVLQLFSSFIVLFFFMRVMLVFLLFCVVVIDWNFDYERLYVVLIRNLMKDVDFIWDLNFFEHRHFDFLDHRVLLDVMMVNGVDAMRFFFFVHFMFFLRFILMINVFTTVKLMNIVKT